MAKKKDESEAIANQLGFAVKELNAVAERMRVAGYAELGDEIQTLANSGAFFAEEYARLRALQIASQQVASQQEATTDAGS